ncbi:alpha/beta fold hydrolase [Nonomuraea sp. NPDC046570]|uniref:alpha/beta fold hydrolase n=1 Tax=Nonomuraea sp. NPDC046570 TaxID=3155255 RepID=UPI0033D7AE2E
MGSSAGPSGGAPDGIPVLLCPGAATSRRLGFGTDVVDALGLRLVSVDRPGLGASAPAPGRTFADFAADIRHLAGLRGLGSPAVVGNSQGAPFALACAVEGIAEDPQPSRIGPCTAPGTPFEDEHPRGPPSLPPHPGRTRHPGPVQRGRHLAGAGRRRRLRRRRHVRHAPHLGPHRRTALGGASPRDPGRPPARRAAPLVDGGGDRARRHGRRRTSRRAHPGQRDRCQQRGADRGSVPGRGVVAHPVGVRGARVPDGRAGRTPLAGRR